MTNLLICGINGKMGKLLYNLANKNQYVVVCGIDKKYDEGFDCPVYKTFYEVKENIELVVDFSSPSITHEVCDFASDNGCPLFIGTTGQNKSQLNYIKKTAQKTAVFMTGNTSLGIFVMQKAINLISKNFASDVSIIEKHHKNKADSPSGTAIMLGKSLTISQKPDYYSVRGGGIAGEHEIDFIAENEMITIKHTAFSRSLFAQGALKCCDFILHKKAGLYGMEDLFCQ